MDKLTILLIDDDRVDRETYKHYLSENNFQVNILEAENAIDGIKLCQMHEIDCIILDYSLPKMNGLDGLEIIKKDHNSIPVIMLTGRGNEHIAVQAMKLGASDYLVKNEINAHILQVTITNAINKIKLFIQNQCYKELENQNLIKNTFLKNISHELKTPLNHIIGFTHLVHKEMLGRVTAKQKQALNRVLTSAHLLLGLINNIINITDFAVGKIKLTPEKFSINSQIEEVVKNLNELINAKQIKIKYDIEEIPTMFLDKKCFHSIVYNYLTNAIKFTPQNGIVYIRIKRESAETIRLEIEDNGIGIKQTDSEKLFISFQQLDSSINKEQQGLGLGLILTKYIVEALGGEVGFTSTFGKGSTFYAILPLKQQVTNIKLKPLIEKEII